MPIVNKTLAKTSTPDRLEWWNISCFSRASLRLQRPLQGFSNTNVRKWKLDRTLDVRERAALRGPSITSFSLKTFGASFIYPSAVKSWGSGVIPILGSGIGTKHKLFVMDTTLSETTSMDYAQYVA